MENTLDQNLSNNGEELVDTLTNLEQSGSLFDSDINVVISYIYKLIVTTNMLGRDQTRLMALL